MQDSLNERTHCTTWICGFHDKISIEVVESSGIAGLNGRTSRANISIQPIEKMPESPKQTEIEALMRAILRD